MPLVTAHHLFKSHGDRRVLEDVSLSVRTGERVGLVGANGSGKSTLARMLTGADVPDAGEVVLRRDASVVALEQDPRFQPGQTARDALLSGLGPWSEARARHRHATAELQAAAGEPDRTATLVAAQAEAEAALTRHGGWEREHAALALLDRLGIADVDAVVDELSGGERRRVALARTLARRPDLAILDEPTNHLDVATIEWLERYLTEEYVGALLLITHDRYVLDRVVTRTLELEAGQLYSYEGGFATYLDAKAERLALARRTEANRQNFLRRELEWLRRQPKARGGKQRARINRIEAARANKPAREQGSLSFQLQSGRAAKTILDLRGLQVAVDGRVLVDGLTLGISRGERVGVLGPNGCGKSTLLRVLAGERPQDGGEVLRGRGLRVAHLDQARGELKGDWSVRRNAAAHAEVIKVGDQTLDVGRYLDRFLFDPADQARRVDTLSGGEQARLALACLLVREVDLALLDEPTNDLDVDTLGAVEEMLLAHDGAAVIVTHDRWFLDRVATSILAFTGDGVVEHYQGDYTTYLALSAEREREREAPPPQAQQPATQAAPAERPRRLTYSEQRELAGLLDRVEQAEERVAALEAELADPESYRDSGERARELGRALAEAREEARTLCARWETLEAIREAAER